MAEPTRTITPPSGPPDPPPPAELPLPAFIQALQAGLPGAIQKLSYWVGDWSVILEPGRLVEVATHLRDAPGSLFNFCSDVTASDWPPRAKRFDVVYSLYSISLRHRVRLKVQVADGEAVPTVSGVWPSANWLEREVFDLFGIRFEGHPDLRRILMPDDWQGHPQRKDYPLEGPGEMLLENPVEWLKVRHAREIE
jgi:NADH-quinone oxidoreductase subunit C